MTKIPDGMTEDQVVQVIQGVAKRFAYKYRFGYYTADDIIQEASLEAWKGLARYDNKRPLENFLWTHVRNRLYNLKRNKFERPDMPCYDCPLLAFDPDCAKSTSGCTAYEDKLECKHYKGWYKRNQSKKNLMNPIELSGVADEHERNMKVEFSLDDALDMKDVFSVLEQYLPLEFKPDYVRAKHGVTIPAPRKRKLFEAIRQILTEHGFEVENGKEAG